MPWIGTILALLSLEGAARLFKSPALPSIYSIAPEVVKLALSGEIFPHIVASLGIIVSGYGSAVLVGFLAAVLFYLLPPVEKMFTPCVDAIRPISAIALMPAMIVMFGLGIISKSLVIFWTAWPAVLLNTIHGLRSVDRDVIGAASIDGYGKIRLLKVVVPIANQSIFTGLRIGLSGGWISLVAAEMLGADSGLGFFVLIQSQGFAYQKMYAGIVYIALVGLSMNTLLLGIQRRFDYEANDSVSHPGAVARV